MVPCLVLCSQVSRTGGLVPSSGSLPAPLGSTLRFQETQRAILLPSGKAARLPRVSFPPSTLSRGDCLMSYPHPVFLVN